MGAALYHSDSSSGCSLAFFWAALPQTLSGGVSKPAISSLCVKVELPTFNDNLWLVDTSEQVLIQTFVSATAVKTLDVGRLGTVCGDPLTSCGGDALWAFAAFDVVGNIHLV